jgi:hypothetical protein
VALPLPVPEKLALEDREALALLVRVPEGVPVLDRVPLCVPLRVRVWVPVELPVRVGVLLCVPEGVRVLVRVGVREQLKADAVYPLLHVVPLRVPPFGQEYDVVEPTVHLPPPDQVPAQFGQEPRLA